MNIPLLKQMIDERLVSIQKHPSADLFIYNYAAKVQYDKLWNEITLQTRGLILDSEFNIIAKPFGKFFNLEEHKPEEIPIEPFEVFEKLDGSLGILYWLNGTPYITTRGSFESDQSKHATNLLHSKYNHLFEKLDRNKTYLFEIIYPKNRIVVDYGDINDLILLTTICNKTGSETIEDIGFPIVKRFDGINDLNDLKSLEEKNKEGFVVRFKSGLRVKMKFAEYVRLHRIITGVSNLAIWEYLRDEKPFDELLEKVPDEFYDWLVQAKSELETQFESIYSQATKAISECYSEDRKTFALSVMEKHKDVAPVVFNIYNKKDHKKLIWRMIRPVFSKAFKTEI